MVPLSFTPVDVIVCGVSQFAEVKVIDAGATVDSATVPDEIDRTTSSTGFAFRTMVKVSVVPDSSTVVDPSVSATVKPATSLSVVVEATVWSATESNVSSELASSTVMVMVEVIVPSTRSSSTPVTVTVCGVSQFSVLKVNGVFTVASPVSLEEIKRTTFDAGCAFRTTVKVSVVPVSATEVDPSVSATVKPATSLSVVVVDTV